MDQSVVAKTAQDVLGSPYKVMGHTEKLVNLFHLRAGEDCATSHCHQPCVNNYHRDFESEDSAQSSISKWWALGLGQTW